MRLPCTNYDNAKVVLVIDGRSANGTTTQAWMNDTYGSTPSTAGEILFSKSDRVRALGVGLMTRASFAYPNATGEWFGEVSNLVLYTEPSAVRPDVNGDGTVDLSDYAYVQNCRTTTGQTLPLECRDADFDNDGDVDTNDIRTLTGCLSGAHVPAAANCVP